MELVALLQGGSKLDNHAPGTSGRNQHAYK